MTQSAKSACYADVTGVGYTLEDLPPLERGPINIAAFFQPKPQWDLPVDSENFRGFRGELEIGSGKGTFLVQEAPRRPEVQFLGIEYAKAFWRHAADRVRRHNLPNVRMLHAEAGLFVRVYVPDATFEQVHIYFPDPWPKARHNKRRLVQAPFLRELWRILKPAGRVRLATDHEDYFAWMCDHAGQVSDIFDRLPFEPPESAGEGELVGSNFERKYRREGRVFNGMVLVKKTVEKPAKK